MNAHKIFTTPIIHEDFSGTRVTPNLYTTTAELERFCDALERVARKGLSTA
jgi:selenocysteine lyase/cysteine desulfurase